MNRAKIRGEARMITEERKQHRSKLRGSQSSDSEMIRGFYSWVLCPVHGHEIQFIRERQAAFYTRCSWWVEMDLNAASLDKN